jgi:4-hydroxybenzoyl-CoA thioesterase
MSESEKIPDFVKGDYIVNRRELTVEWGHCDPAGIVFHPRFIEYFDWACALLLEKATGLKKARLREAYGFAGFPIVDLQAKFLVPVSYGDDVKIYSTIASLKRSSFAIRHCLTKSGAVAVECTQTRVWCVADPADPHKLKAAAVPDEVVARLKRSSGA